MNPSLPTSTTANQNPRFYTQLLAWIQANLVAYLKANYGLTVTVFGVQVSLPLVDSNTGLAYYDQFYLVWPDRYMNPVDYQTCLILGADVASIASKLLADYADDAGIPVPQPLPQQAVTTVPVIPPAPSDPVGAKLPDGRYNNLAGNSLPIGAVYTDSRGPFALAGVATPFGTITWWVPTMPTTPSTQD